uniref:Uncharacterized protein n=1 Tax=Glossina pallidipes TaxID=7398 RepID=A0A1A9ZPH5_GLOPL
MKFSQHHDQTDLRLQFAEKHTKTIARPFTKGLKPIIPYTNTPIIMPNIEEKKIDKSNGIKMTALRTHFSSTPANNFIKKQKSKSITITAFVKKV